MIRSDHEPTSFSQIFIGVTAVHLGIFFLILSLSWWTSPPPKQEWIQMVALGELSQGEPEGKEQSRPLPPPLLPPPSPPLPSSALQPKPVVKKVQKPTRTPKPPPAQVKPAPRRPKVQVDLREVTRSVASSKPSPSSHRDAFQETTALMKKLETSLEKAGVRQKKLQAESGAPNGTFNEFAPYYRLIRDQMFEKWKTPDHLLGQGLTTIVSITIDSQGNIVEERVTKSSGNTLHDESALQAVRHVKKIKRPPPPGLDPHIEVTFRMDNDYRA